MKGLNSKWPLYFIIGQLNLDHCFDSGTPAARRAAKRSPISVETEPHVCIEIGTYATLFIWSTWLAAWIMGVCAQQRR